MKIERISPSACSMALKCGEQYRFRYIEGLVLPPGFAIIRGRGAHKGVEVNLSQKIQSGEDLPSGYVCAAAADEVDAQLVGEVKLDPDYEEMGFDKAKGLVKDEAVSLAKLHLHVLAPKIKPRAVEVKIEMPPSQALPLTVVGVLDVVDAGDVIHDTKTSKKKPPKTAADDSDQLTWYELLHRARWKKPSQGQRLDYLVRTPAGNMDAVVLKTERTVVDLKRAIRTAERVSDMVRTEAFVPAPDSAWWCSKKWCGYHPDAGGPCKFGRRSSRPTS